MFGFNFKNCLARVIAVVATTLLMTSPMAESLASNKSIAQDSSSRYVWADKLVIHAQPDINSPALASLMFGDQISLSSIADTTHPYSVTVFKLEPDDEGGTESNVTLDGYWKRVNGHGVDGWVFDGFLSRYPVPKAIKKVGMMEDQVSYANQIFKELRSLHWTTGDKKSGSHYAAMRKHVDASIRKDYHVDWKYAEFSQGVYYDDLTYYDVGTVGRTWFRKLPLTFNEAVLWLRLFGDFTSIPESTKTGAGQRNGHFVRGKSLTVGVPNDDESGIGNGSIVDCHGDTCDIGWLSSD